ncbi:MAG: N-acetylmuramoyl-L-alanine amidase family protein [Bacillota bacterium]
MRFIFIPRSGLWLLAGGMVFTIFTAGIILFFEGTRKTNGWLREIRILVDPGHGGVDGGTKDYQGNLEKDTNLKVALRLRRHLYQSGFRVFLTRKTDRDLSPSSHYRDLMARIRKYWDYRCLLLVSIHCDWSPDFTKKGARVFYNLHSPESKRLAECVQAGLNKFQEAPKRALPGRFFIINQPGVTGVLVEIGLMSNRENAEKLQNRNYQEQLALVIAGGILNYCGEYLLPSRAYFYKTFALGTREL